MGKQLVVIFLSIFLGMGIYASFSQAFAQDAVNETAPENGAITTNDTAATTASDDAFDLFWILPIVAIPILIYLLWPKRKEDAQYASNLAGAKGGKAEAEEEDEDLDENYTPEPPRYRD